MSWTGNRLGYFRLSSESHDEVIKDGRQKDAEDRYAEHPREDGDSERAPHFRTGAERQRERYNAQDERERSHDDRP